TCPINTIGSARNKARIILFISMYYNKNTYFMIGSVKRLNYLLLRLPLVFLISPPPLLALLDAGSLLLPEALLLRLPPPWPPLARLRSLPPPPLLPLPPGLLVETSTDNLRPSHSIVGSISNTFSWCFLSVLKKEKVFITSTRKTSSCCTANTSTRKSFNRCHVKSSFSPIFKK